MDTYTLSLKNFRSVDEATVEIAPLTILYGPNGSGKSSLIYGLLTLRNFLTNSNQNLPSLFFLSFHGSWGTTGSNTSPLNGQEHLSFYRSLHS